MERRICITDTRILSQLNGGQKQRELQARSLTMMARAQESLKRAVYSSHPVIEGVCVVDGGLAIAGGGSYEQRRRTAGIP